MHIAGPGINLGLERIERLLQGWGNPHKRLKAVHVTGTNGKGSTSLIIATVLQKAGYKVGSFTSPHLHSYRERITINGEPIPGEVLLAYLRRIKAIAEAMEREGLERPTEFEVLTAVAFRYFADQGVEVGILEVGMGGRYDSTNVVLPVISVITRVEMDHTGYLGETIKEIARNKAGIIKPAGDVVVGNVAGEALQVIKEECRKTGARLWEATAHVKVSVAGAMGLGGQPVSIETPGLELEDAFFSLPGAYQLENLGTAMMVISLLKAKGWKINDEAIREALAALRWPGRLEVVCDRPLVVIDAAHNPDGTRALATSLQELLPGLTRVLVCGILDDKEARPMLKNLAASTRLCIITRPVGERSRNWREKAVLARQFFPRVDEEENIDRALERAVRECLTHEYILVAGSFYVLDLARQYFSCC